MDGMIFGRWRVLCQASDRDGDQVFWKCRCECGTEKVLAGGWLRSGDTKSCGCLRKERMQKLNFKHGHGRHLLRSVFKNIIDRCENENNKSYKDYGLRGISVCDEWRDSYISFFEWALKTGYEHGLEIDRIDNNNGYSPENCRFTTKTNNIKNQRTIIASNTSGYRGVSKIHKTEKYVAYAKSNGEWFYLGRHKTAKEAAMVRDEFVIKNILGLPLNFPR